MLTTARFESRVTFTIEEHLRQQGVEPPATARHNRKKAKGADRPVVHYSVRGVPVTLLLTHHNDETRPDRRESAQYLRDCSNGCCGTSRRMC